MSMFIFDCMNFQKILLILFFSNSDEFLSFLYEGSKSIKFNDLDVWNNNVAVAGGVSRVVQMVHTVYF